MSFIDWRNKMGFFNELSPHVQTLINVILGCIVVAWCFFAGHAIGEALTYLH